MNSIDSVIIDVVIVEQKSTLLRCMCTCIITSSVLRAVDSDALWTKINVTSKVYVDCVFNNCVRHNKIVSGRFSNVCELCMC